jgi:hypothetical protein
MMREGGIEIKFQIYIYMKKKREVLFLFCILTTTLFIIIKLISYGCILLYLYTTKVLIIYETES